ncbi:MAG: response regulator [Actinobacteria bacterium]|nr:response regulator [Actinomycetota bacterium]
MPRLLIVEDEPALRRALTINLKARHYEVEAVGTGGAALRTAASSPPDLVIVDLGLPDLDGVDVIAGLRGWSRVPIIVLSARDSQAQKVRALDAGADDYVTKPFGMDELVARVRAALRRADVPDLASGAVVMTAAFTLDLAAKRATRDGAEVRLTPTEWHLVEALLRHPGTLVSGAQLLAEVWGPGYEKETNYLRVYFAQLRRKLEDEPSNPRHFITEPGLGYRFEP